MRIYGKALSGRRIIGEPKLFSLEERIFNTVLLIAFITLVFEVPFNFLIGLYVPAALCFVGLFLAAYLYYLSRFKRKSSVGITIFCLLCNLMFAINYFFNSGTRGPNLLLFSLAFLLVVAIIPKRQFLFWLSINVLTVLTILLVEYFYPQLAPNVYKSEVWKTIDFSITYLVVVSLTYFTISYIRKNYDQERDAVDEKNTAIEEQRQELERLNSEKDKLFSIVTHDIRAPLASIQGYLELLTEVNLDEAERLDIKKQLLQLTRATSGMLTNVLSWSRTQMEGAHAELKKVNISDVLTDALTVEKSIAKAKGIMLNVSYEDGLQILADYNMLQLVLRNLVNNALKFTPNGGRVEVKAMNSGNSCHILIKDNGLGIDPIQQERLFQLNAASTYGTNNEKGVGLGLPLCREFTTLQHGKIWFESELGKGSTFYLSFRNA
ncbi:MAG: HAMP domain-containing sensor histidine kinase [Pedobacter sp.]|nr:HAMP domain-containing sensor histidine kinase [Pedobacter sp.]